MKNISNYFGSKILLPKILHDCRINSLPSETNYNIGKVYLFEKNIYNNVCVIEDNYTDEIIYIGTSITGYVKFDDWHISIPNGVDIIGKNVINSEMIIKNIFITKNTRSMKNNRFSNYIKFVASKILLNQSE